MMFDKERLEQIKKQEEEIEKQSISEFSPEILENDAKELGQSKREILETNRELKKAEKSSARQKESVQEVLEKKETENTIVFQNNNFEPHVGDDIIRQTNKEFDELEFPTAKIRKERPPKQEKTKKHGFLKGLAFIVVGYIAAMAILIGGYFAVSAFYQSGTAREYEMTDKTLFYLDKFNNDNIRVSKFKDNKIYFNLKKIPEGFKDSTIEALRTLEKELQIFDFKIVMEETVDDIEIRCFTPEEHGDEINKTDGADNKYIGWCSFTMKGYDFIQKKYSREHTVIAIDTIQHNTYLNKVNEADGKKQLVNTINKCKEFFYSKTVLFDKDVIDIVERLKANIDNNTIYCGDADVFKLAELIDSRIDAKVYSDKDMKDAKAICGNLYNIYLNHSREGVFEKYKRTVIHEAIHAIFYAQDIANPQNPYFIKAKSIMSYNPEMRSYKISDFDRKYIIKPQMVNILLKNKELCDYLGYDYVKVEKEAELLELAFPYDD